MEPEKFHCHVHKNLLMVLILSQINLVHTLPPCFPKIHSNIILPSKPWSSEWSPSLVFSNKNYICTSHLYHVCYMPHPSHSSCLDHPKNIW